MRWIILIILGTPIGLFFLATDSAATLEKRASYNLNQLSQANLLAQRINPQNFNAGETYIFEIKPSDLQVLMTYQWTQQSWFSPWQQNTRILSDTLHHQFSGQFNLFGLTRFLNLDIELVPDQPIASIRTLKIGQITLPNAANRWVESLIWQKVAEQGINIDAFEPETKITQQGNLLLSFKWQPWAI